MDRHPNGLYWCFSECTETPYIVDQYLRSTLPEVLRDANFKLQKTQSALT